jgi:Serine dehydrogenase proteinase
VQRPEIMGERGDDGAVGSGNDLHRQMVPPGVPLPAEPLGLVLVRADVHTSSEGLSVTVGWPSPELRGLSSSRRAGPFIDDSGYPIEDSEALIRAIEMTGRQMPIDLVLHTPGGLVLAAEQIASALAAHEGPVTVYVPHYAMSGGTLIALAADRIVLSPSA